jgi:hypothetical protein
MNNESRMLNEQFFPQYRVIANKKLLMLSTLTHTNSLVEKDVAMKRHWRTHVLATFSLAYIREHHPTS